MRTPRSERFWKSPTDFDRQPVVTPIAELLAGIPENLWDTPLESLLWESPRDAARHVNESGCPSCRDNLAKLRKEHA